MSDKIYIIVVTFNGMKWLPKCLKSTSPYPVIVVDNNSSDESVDFIEKEFPEIEIIRQKKNLGFGQANNLGISLALRKGAEYVFLLNQDAYLQNGALERLVDTQKGNLTFGILSPIHLDGKGNLLDRKFSNYVNYNSNKNFYSDFILKKPLKEVYDVPFVNAAGWLITRNCLQKVGGFDPIFFHYGEDVNLCQRISYYGFKMGVVPCAILMHEREKKKELVVEYGSKIYYDRWIRELKIKYADINKNDLYELESLIRKKKQSIIKTFLKGRIRALASYRLEVQLLEKTFTEIHESRNLNKAGESDFLYII